MTDNTCLGNCSTCDRRKECQIGACQCGGSEQGCVGLCIRTDGAYPNQEE